MAGGPLNIARKSLGGRGGIASHRIGKPGGPIAHPEPFSFPSRRTAYSFTPTKAGYWKFVLWGPGAGGSSGSVAGASGAYAEVTRFLTPSQTVSIVSGQSFNGTLAADSTVTFPDGSVVTAGAASVATAGVASGADFSLGGTAGVVTGNLTGNAGAGTGGGAGAPGTGASSGGAGAPGRLPYRGGVGAGGSSPAITATIGGGGTESVTSGAPGHVLALLISE